jgi:hypothetical protein
MVPVDVTGGIFRPAHSRRAPPRCLVPSFDGGILIARFEGSAHATDTVARVPAMSRMMVVYPLSKDGGSSFRGGMAYNIICDACCNFTPFQSLSLPSSRLHGALPYASFASRMRPKMASNSASLARKA